MLLLVTKVLSVIAVPGRYVLPMECTLSSDYTRSGCGTHPLDDYRGIIGYGEAPFETEITSLSDPFADIRPYRDDEVVDVLARLLKNPDFLGALASFKLGRLAALAPALVRPLVRYQLSREVRDVSDVLSMQMVISRYMERMIGSTTGGFTVSGLDRLDAAKPYLFMSNHRDIAMDPAFTNMALHRHGCNTVRIAIGDNLLTMPWVSDLMRLNKSFIVKRSVNGPRELLAASRNLANYIQHSLHQEQESVWIAQREGRAKNGVDRTEPVIIKMLSMSRDKKNQAFGEHIQGLGIVPVAISFELDPCDAMKARELHDLETVGVYEKGEQEDVGSIAKGIAGNKGRVHVSFGSPLPAGLDTPDAVAREVDRQIISEYCLHPTNLYAYRRLHGEEADLSGDLNLEAGDCSEADFDARINAMPEEHRPHALGIYANAVVSKLAHRDGAKPLAE